MNQVISIRDKSILIGLYLSKYDTEALEMFEFKTTIQAFNTLGYAIGAKPSSIKNYRDEFDPYFPNTRKGWHKRELRQYCKVFLDNFHDVSFEDFTELIKSFVVKNYEIRKIVENAENKDYSTSIARRLITGKAAEEYFKINYQKVNQFTDHILQDTTNFGCGFDFRLYLESNFYCIEVKGLNAITGSITMTEKEFCVAQNLKDKYCLFIVSNFVEKPRHEYFFDPLNCKLNFKKSERHVLQTSYSTAI